ncbi:MAG: TIGR00730 family Rossman fold protein [Deltaproteobacteria bacterium]|nr:TIGR00730 family Rossman fold protein [Deltaproteobacteria bacterium]
MNQAEFLLHMKGALKKDHHRDYYEQMFLTLWKLYNEEAPLADVKLINSALKELRYTTKILGEYRDERKVSIFGSARSSSTAKIYKHAKNFARKMSDNGFMVITGAGPGIMEAANAGAGKKSSFGFNIRLPFEQKANPYIENDSKLIHYKYFFTRKLAFIKETNAVVFFPGGFGTLDECFEVLTLLQTGKSLPMPVICIDKPGGNYWKQWFSYIKRMLLKHKMIAAEDLKLVRLMTNIDEAVEYIQHFYSNYHSIRYVNKTLFIRTLREIPDKALGVLNKRYKSILVQGGIEKTGPHEIEHDEPTHLHLKRIKLHFNKTHFGKLYQLIEELNKY